MELTIKTMPLTSLSPADYNPRKDLTPEDPQYKKLRRLIQEFDLVEPLVWNEQTGNLVSGHQRLKILQELGRTETEATVVDLDTAKEKKLNILLNRARGRWDREKLADLMIELDEADAIDLTGFEDWELQGMIDDDSMLEDILDYEPPEENEEEADDGTDDEPETFALTLELPVEYADEIDNYLADTGENNALAILAEGIVRLCEGVA